MTEFLLNPRWPPHLAAFYEAMTCDHTGGCKAGPLYAVALIVQSKTPDVPGHQPIVWVTDLHYCDAHKGELRVDTLFTDRFQARIERFARKYRPLGFRCDFGWSTFIDYVDIFGDSYRHYLETMRLKAA